MKLIIILMFITLTGYLVLQPKSIFAAQPDLTNKTLISNVTDSSFTVSYFTQSPKLTEVDYGENQANTVLKDDRDGDKPALRYSHYVTLKNLKEHTVYRLKVYKDTPEVVRQTTAYKNPYYPPSHITLSGNVISLTGFPGKDGVMYLLIGNSQLLSSPIDDGGRWSFNAVPIMSRNYGHFLRLRIWDVIDLYAQTGIDGLTSAKTLVAQNQPVTLYLSLAKIPFYRMQLGPIDSYATSSAQPVTSSSASAQSTASATFHTSSFFDIIWVTIYDLFR